MVSKYEIHSRMMEEVEVLLCGCEFIFIAQLKKSTTYIRKYLLAISYKDEANSNKYHKHFLLLPVCLISSMTFYLFWKIPPKEALIT